VIDALVTGAHGFIGRPLCSRLIAAGKTVLPLGQANGDVADSSTWASLPSSKVVYHLAGRSYVPDSWNDGPEFVRTNVVGTEQALAYCRRHSAKLVLASAYVYGIPAHLPIQENDPVQPNNPYAVTKRLAEQLCEFSALYQNVSTTVLRLFNVFGHGQRAEFLIPRMLEQLTKGGEIHLMDLSPRRDYVYLDDVVSAFIAAGKVECGFHILNIGSGRSNSVQEIIDIIQSVAGTSLSVVSAAIERPQEIPDVVADISRAEQVLGWRPQWSFRDGIANMLTGS
jgi:GDP-4-dehydro-6-deoxy-D-mannose reductase